MGFAQGVQAGTQAARQWAGGNTSKSNPYAAMGAIDATLKQLNKRLSPAMIRNNAASMANQERAIELQERKQDFVESQAALAEDKRRWATEEQTGQQLRQDAALAGQAEGAAGEEYRAETGEIREQERHDVEMGKGDQAEDFKMVQWAVANRKAGPIVEFVNKHGNKSSNLRGISWNENGEVLVFPENEQEKPGYFKDNEELMKSFVGFMDPKVESKVAKLAKEGTGEKTKGSVTPSQHRLLRNDARKRYKEAYRDTLGGLKKGAPDEEKWINQEVEKEISATVGDKGAQQAISPDSEKAGYKTLKDPKTGNTLRKYPDGRQEVINPEGKVIGTRGGNGAGKAGARYSRDKAGGPVATVKIPERGGSKASEAIPDKVEKKARASGTATYTDPKTGKKMEAIMRSDGTIETKEVDKGKDKKKNKITVE